MTRDGLNLVPVLNSIDNLQVEQHHVLVQGRSADRGRRPHHHRLPARQLRPSRLRLGEFREQPGANPRKQHKHLMVFVN